MMARNLSLTLSIVIAAAAARTAHGQYYPALAEVSQRYWDALMERYPTWATSLGDDRFNDRLEDVSDTAREEWNKKLDKFYDEVRQIRHMWLSQPDQVTRLLLMRTIQDEKVKLELRQDFTPLDPIYGVHIRLPLILVAQPFRNVKDYHDYAARLRSFSKQVTDTITNMRSGVILGWTHPRVILEKSIPQLRAQLVADVRGSDFYGPVKKADHLSEADRAAVTAEITDAIAGHVIPAYLQLLAFAEDEYLYAARSTVGVGALEHGDRLYKALVKLHTTEEDDPHRIHGIGHVEVARIRGEMAKIKEEVGFEGTLNEFLAHMRTDPMYRFNSETQLVDAADAILKRTVPRLPELFGRLPKVACEMKVMEPFRAAAAPAAFYNAASEDGSRPGYFYINTYKPEERLRFTIEALTYHEAIPGHHLQADVARQNEQMPMFRRHASYTAFVEGWALYAEKLGYEIDGYQDPYARFGQLTFEMWRACRLVVDTGIHAKGWTRQQAIDFLSENNSLSKHDIEAEVDRYIAWPGQALAYKLGERKILALRDEAERELGDRFDIRDFHDHLLRDGAMPLDMLEKQIHDWIERTKP